MNYKEELLTTIINHVISKGAPLLGWTYSKNGKIIIFPRNGIPLFCINIFQAIDLLIHQYNLAHEYSFIYSQVKNKVDLNLTTPNQTIKMSEDTFESKTIALCDSILLNPSQPFNIEAQNKIYNAINRANEGKHVSQNDFFMLRIRLSEHYSNILRASKGSKEKENLRNIVRFFEKMSYKNFIELF
jgi:hypothetical protein